MNIKAMTALEFHKITDRLAQKAITQAGKDRARNLNPSTDIDQIRLWQRDTTEAVNIAVKRGSLPLGGYKDVTESVKRAVIGGMLSIQELLDIGDFLYVCSKLSAYREIEIKNMDFPGLNPYFEQITTIPQLEREIRRCIVNQQDIADQASPGLHSVRMSIQTANDRIRQQLNSIIHSQSYKNMLQDAVITIRSQRFCVPIKQEYRNSFPGMVHDQSATGATLFIEPMSVVNLNNKISELRVQEKIEIEKILLKLSQTVAENADILQDNNDAAIHLDFVFAKGELSLQTQSVEPKLNQNGYINIVRGRHPLLDPDKVVPTDIYLGDKFTTLLITGPNTGGKTVALKTLGLFTLMAQSGLHIGAKEFSEIAVFDNVFADIGDEQSIEQSLSTFSSHMSNIVKILGETTDNSLVLLDELGAGTDPTEGAALAIAILQDLHQRAIRTAVTTHYSELKVYALSTEGVENASCEFDVYTLRPTYKLLIGTPGKSNAFAISQKLGLPEHIIDSAKNILSQEDARFEDVITDLEISKQETLAEQEKARVLRRESERLHAELKTQQEKLNAQRDKIMLEAKENARNLVMQAKSEADDLIKSLRRQVKDLQEKNPEAIRQKLGDKLNKLDKDIVSLTRSKQKYTPAPKTLKKGDRVFIHSLNSSAEVISSVDSNDEVMVQAGIMKIKLPRKDLSLDKSQGTVTLGGKEITHSVKAGKSQHISPQIDIRGHMVEEGIEKTDKYLDDAYLSGLAQVTIIHGKGTGALRAAIQNHLKSSPHVKSFRPGTFGEGEAGVTVVELKK